MEKQTSTILQVKWLFPAFTKIFMFALLFCSLTTHLMFFIYVWRNSQFSFPHFDSFNFKTYLAKQGLTIEQLCINVDILCLIVTFSLLLLFNLNFKSEGFLTPSFQHWGVPAPPGNEGLCHVPASYPIPSPPNPKMATWTPNMRKLTRWIKPS